MILWHTMILLQKQQPRFQGLFPLSAPLVSLTPTLHTQCLCCCFCIVRAKAALFSVGIFGSLDFAVSRLLSLTGREARHLWEVFLPVSDLQVEAVSQVMVMSSYKHDQQEAPINPLWVQPDPTADTTDWSWHLLVQSCTWPSNFSHHNDASTY